VLDADRQATGPMLGRRDRWQETAAFGLLDVLTL
jgi:hypothetical protein